MIPGKAYSHDELLRCGWRRRWYIAVPFVLAAAATVVALVVLPDKYRAETLLQVVPQRVPASYARGTATAPIDGRLYALTQQILSRAKLELIIVDFKLYADERTRMPLEDVIEGMRKDITVQSVKGDSFRVAYVSDTPQMAKRVTDRLTALFIDENLRERAGIAESTEQFIGAQLVAARERLVEHERKLEAYRRLHVGELPSQVSGNIQSLQSLQVQLQTLTESLNRDIDARAAIERQLAEAPAASVETIREPDAAGASAGGTPRQQLEAARAALQAMALRLKPTHPDIVRLRRQVAEFEQRVDLAAAQTPLGASGALVAASQRTAAERDTLSRRIVGKERQVQELRLEMNRYQARLDAAPTRESELIELTRDYDTLRTLYTNLLVKSEESRVAVKLEEGQVGEQFRVLSAARLPWRPFSPDRPTLAGVGLLAGLAAGLGLAALLEYRDNSMRTDEDVLKALGVRVVAAIPVMNSDAQRRRLRWRSLGFAATGTVLMIGASALAWNLLS